MKCTYLVGHLFILLSSILSINAYEIWSVYFDESNPNVQIQKDIDGERYHLREQFFDLPFINTRHIFEIATYVNAATKQNIIRMELNLCEPFRPEQQHLPRDATKIDPRDNRSWACLQKIVSQRSPLVCNETILRFPSDVGLPLGYDEETGGEQKLMLIIEYDRDYRSLSDNSGFDLYLADGRLPIESGIMAIGMVPDARFFIPPNVTHWTTKGTCFTSCFDSSLESSPLKVVGLFPSTGHHLLQEMTVEIDARHKEKQTIFAWGGGRSVDIGEEPIIERKNEIHVRCVYNSTTNGTVLGGLGSSHDQENCLVWMHYYPKMKTPSACLSSYTTATLMSLLDLNELNLSIDFTRSQINFVDEGEKMIESEVKQRDARDGWSIPKLIRSKFIREQGRQRAQCNWERNTISKHTMANDDQMINDSAPALIDVRQRRRLLLPSLILWR